MHKYFLISTIIMGSFFLNNICMYLWEYGQNCYWDSNKFSASSLHYHFLIVGFISLSFVWPSLSSCHVKRSQGPLCEFNSSSVIILAFISPTFLLWHFPLNRQTVRVFFWFLLWFLYKILRDGYLCHLYRVSHLLI